MLVRETFVIHSRLSWRQVRGAAAIEHRHGLQALAIEHLVARLDAHQIANPLNLLDVFGGRSDYQFNKINGLGVKSDRLLALCDQAASGNFRTIGLKR
jgi:hypothetical protein